MATNFIVKIDKIGLVSFIRRSRILKRSGISQFQFQKVHLRLLDYIV